MDSKNETVSDLLDEEIFTCCKCGQDFDHTQGTWLPIGEEDKRLAETTSKQ